MNPWLRVVRDVRVLLALFLGAVMAGCAARPNETVLNGSIGTVGVWEYEAGRFTEITGPTDRRIKEAARRS